MENQHRKIIGYRELSEDEINLMNEIKETGQRFAELFTRIEAMHKAEAETLQSAYLPDNIESHLDARRWAATSKTQIQQGIMALTRAVARPTSF